MKKVGVILLLICFMFPLILAANSTTNSTNTDGIKKGFVCLDEKVGDCSDLTTQEIALTILATPDKSFDSCVSELKKRMSSDNWDNVRDTALAVLALKHAGQDTKLSEEWLIEQSKTPTNLIWYLEEDSNGETECHIGYESSDYIINIGENKKIDKDAGSCLTKTQSNYWFTVSQSCYDKEFTLECNQNFIATFLYKNKNSPTIYVLEGTQSSPAFGTLKLKVNSKCFGDSSCDYEATIWTTLALLKTGHNIEEYIPYIIAMSDTNKGYFPESFIYMLTNYEDYANKIISSQKLGNYWESDKTAYNRYYDTSLAILAIGKSSSSEQIKNAKDWMLFSQGADGCWQNIKETAIALWALEGRAGKNPTNSVKYCTQSNYFCIATSSCPTSDKVIGDYYCPTLSDSCCMTENLKSCSEYSGKICSSDKVCTGNIKKATDTTNCCLGECEEKQTETECESMFYTCSDECSKTQEPIDYACDIGKVCCRTKEVSTKKSSWWIWLIIAIAIVLIAILALRNKEKLKLWWFKFRSGYKKDKGNRPPQSPQQFPMSQQPYGARPGFPPIRRMPQPVPTQQRRPPYNPEDKSMSDVFSKLKNMSK
jgi:hypothetical protein